jgi:hypothetical protein
MPKTIIPTVATSASKLDADKFNRALYSPTPRVAGSKSLDVINGHIDSSNLNEPSEDYPDYRKEEAQIPMNMIRRGALARSKTSSDLGPTHFDRNLWKGMTIHEKYIPIPGCGVSIFVPSSGLVALTWQVSIGHDGRPEGPSDGAAFDITREENYRTHPWQTDSFEPVPNSVERCFLTLLKRDGFSLDEVPGHRFELPLAKGTYSSFQPDPGLGRTWSGHKLIQFNEEKNFGWHHYTIGVSSQALNTMIRVRNMKYVWFNK